MHTVEEGIVPNVDPNTLCTSGGQTLKSDINSLKKEKLRRDPMPGPRLYWLSCILQSRIVNMNDASCKEWFEAPSLHVLV